jgi:hydroxypyruvate reductase
MQATRQETTMKRDQARTFFLDLFRHAVDAVLPERCLPAFLQHIPAARGRTLVIGAGKASAAMAQALEAHWPHPIDGGLVVTRHGQGLPCRHIEIMEAAHPVPDTASETAARRILQLVAALSEQDQVICLMSGGGSSLLACPADGLTLADKQQINRALLASGATIAEINCVRKHLSGIKGGRLALACAPATVHNLFISDIPGDDATLIASGPTLPDASTLADARAVLTKYAITVAPHIHAHLTNPANETAKPDDARFARQASNTQHTIASARHMLEAAAAFARLHGINAHILSDAIEGEAREIGKMHAAIASHIAHHNQPFTRPCLLLSGGETSVTVRGKGKGGRNTEFLLSMALALQGLPGVHAMAVDTDGIDGSEDNAGATLHPDSLLRATQAGLNLPHNLPAALLQQNNSHAFFAAIEDVIISGPLATNVNDLRAVLIS